MSHSSLVLLTLENILKYKFQMGEQAKQLLPNAPQSFPVAERVVQNVPTMRIFKINY